VSENLNGIIFVIRDGEILYIENHFGIPTREETSCCNEDVQAVNYKQEVEKK